MPAEEQLVRIDGHRLRLTNLEKVLYPETGTTKGEVLHYYSHIAPLLIAHATGRPVTRKRWVDGVGTAEHPEPSFFAKALEAGAPDWIPRRAIAHSTGAKDYPLVDDVATLVYLAQVASLELHIPQWRFEAGPDEEGAAPPRTPDRLVLDLDPGEGVGLAHCADVARWARDILTGMGLDPVPVTSGSKGIHLYAALPGDQTSEQIAAFAKELARALEADHPDLVVSAMSKALRAGKVFIDWSQNNAAKTTIAPYSLRGRDHPTVAAPRTWAELEDPHLAQLMFTDVLERAETLADPMAALGYHSGGRHSANGPLSAYISMRSASRTPEPVPRSALAEPVRADRQPRFVIQEHHASRLHYDFRLERHGVLVSWAVPKGVPETTGRNHLAVMTEDHPLEYATFEGTIPRGEYGAGSVTIWDAGTYELEKWRDDEIIVTVTGRPGGPLGRVRLALIRTDGRGEKSTWLMHRMKPDAAGQAQTPAMSAAHPPVSPAQRLAADIQPMLATTSTPALARDASRRWGAGAAAPWVEFKWDGIRAIGMWDGAALRLFTRSGAEVTARYPELTAGGGLQLGAEPVIVDGELVALDDRGRPSFSRLQSRMNLATPREIAAEAARTPVTYYLFDILASGGADLGGLPLRERRGALDELAATAEPPVAVPPVFDDIDAALATAREFGLEGVMVKDPRSRYRQGVRSEEWLKIKLTHTQEVVIGGIRPGRGARAGAIGSLLVGVPGEGGLHYVGRVGSGFGEAALARLEGVLTPMRADVDPFVGVPPADASDALWLRPELVGEVEFAEWTPGGILRQARWRGLRPDKSPAEVTREG